MPNLTWIKTDQIDSARQVRSEMNPDALRNLAEDIRANGLLQPIIVRPVGARWRIIIGHRRHAACKLIGLEQVPTITGTANNSTILQMQLAENLHREDLGDEDLSAALNELYAEHHSLETVALIVNKSKSWVCKKMQLGISLHSFARDLWEDGITEDGELLATVNKLTDVERQSSAYSAPETARLCSAIRAGTANRYTAREVLARVKTAAAIKRVAHAKHTEDTAPTKPAPAPKPRKADRLALDMTSARWSDTTPRQIYASWMDKERVSFHATAVEAWIQGAKASIKGHEDPCVLMNLAILNEQHAFKLARLAGYSAADGVAFDLEVFLDQLTRLFAPPAEEAK